MQKITARKPTTYKLCSKIWLYQGMAGWHFINDSKKESADIKERFGKNAKGWGSIPVCVTLGKTSWDTSIFPDKKSGTYLLPLKASVRRAEGVSYDDVVDYMLKIRN